MRSSCCCSFGAGPRLRAAAEGCSPGVFFDKNAITFDPAPFRLAATMANAQALQTYLTKATSSRPALSPDPDLASFTTSEQTLASAMPSLALKLAAIEAGTTFLPGSMFTRALAEFLLSRSYPTVSRGECAGMTGPRGSLPM
jgi:hypothetical protein